VNSAGDRPAVTRLARWQAAQGSRLTNQHHVPVEISSQRPLALLGLLDGTRTRAELLADFSSAELDECLERFAKLALLVA
jgi:hypothetical protein